MFSPQFIPENKKISVHPAGKPTPAPYKRMPELLLQRVRNIYRKQLSAFRFGSNSPSAEHFTHTFLLCIYTFFYYITNCSKNKSVCSFIDYRV